MFLRLPISPQPISPHRSRGHTGIDRVGSAYGYLRRKHHSQFLPTSLLSHARSLLAGFAAGTGSANGHLRCKCRGLCLPLPILIGQHRLRSHARALLADLTTKSGPVHDSQCLSFSNQPSSFARSRGAFPEHTMLTVSSLLSSQHRWPPMTLFDCRSGSRERAMAMRHFTVN